MDRLRAALVLLAVVTGGSAATVVGQVADLPRVYTGREAEIEAYMKEAEVERFRDLSIGITRPGRAWFKPGGPVDSVAFKAIRPGVYKKFYESYKSEIAAYELDKLLELHMVPPAVERKIHGVMGAAIMWIDDVRMWREMRKEQQPSTREWNAQMVRMRMFDALIGNSDRNSGNILVDKSWVIYLIDHSRAFLPHAEPPIKLVRVDRDLWSRMEALDKDGLERTMGRWLDSRMIDLLLNRRNRMRHAIEKLVAAQGEDRIFIHD